jgi:hypothetical protein
MGIGVEEAVFENLGQQDVGAAAGDQLAVVAVRPAGPAGKP